MTEFDIANINFIVAKTRIKMPNQLKLIKIYK